MDVPLEIAFHNLESSAAVETRVRERVAKLEKLFPRLVACRVVVEDDSGSAVCVAGLGSTT